MAQEPKTPKIPAIAEKIIVDFPDGIVIKFEYE